MGNSSYMGGNTDARKENVEVLAKNEKT